jgi:hypothetical protein
MLDVFKTIHPNLRAEDLAYVTENGKINYNKAAAVMQRITKEAVSADQIENAIRANLDSTDLNQMAITGRYTFKDIPPENLERYYTQQVNGMSKKIDAQMAGLQQIINTSASDPETLNKAKEAMDNLQARKDDLPEQLQSTLEMIRNNPDAAKAQIYKEGAISQFSESMSWENAKLELLKSPVRDQMNWELDHALDISKFNLDVDKNKFDQWYKRETLDVSKRHAAVAEGNLAINMKKAVADINGPDSGADVYLGQSTKIKDQNLAMMQEMTDLAASRNSMVTKLSKDMGVSPETALKSLEDFRKGKIDAIPKTLRSDANDILEADKKAANYSQIIKNAKDETDKDPIVMEARARIGKELVTAPGLTFNTRDGRRVYYSAQEIYDIHHNRRTNTAKQKEFDKLYMDAYTRGGARTIKNVMNNIDIIKNRGKSIENVYKERYSEILKEKTGKFVPAMYNIDVLEKDGSRNRMEGVAMSLMKKMAGGIAGQKGEELNLMKMMVRQLLIG